MEFFPSQWIEPNEYSFCGGCGKNETLMKCHHRDRPACLFCKGITHPPMHPFKSLCYAVRYLKLKHWGLPIERCIRYILSKKYRVEFKEINDRIKDSIKERSDQIHSSMQLHKERNELARFRRDTLKRPAVYWMKNNNGNTRTQVVAKRVDT
jgi:hypothetical protein